MSFGNDWDDILDLELETVERSSGASSSRAAAPGESTEHVQQSVLVGVRVSEKPKRGRPFGTTKLVMAQRRAEEEESQSQAAEARPGPGNMQLVRDAKARKSAEAKAKALATQADGGMQLPTVYGPISLLMSLGVAVHKTIGAALVAICKKTKKLGPAEGSSDDTDRDIVSHIQQGDVLTCSSSSIAKVTKAANRTVVQRSLLAVASATLHGAGLMWSMMLTSLQQCAGTAKPILFVLSLKYDETPTRIRVATLPSEGGSEGGVADRHLLVPRVASSGLQLQRFLEMQSVAPRVMPQSATHAKVLQTEVKLGVLYQRCATGGAKEHFWLSGSVPTCLQAMDRSTGEAQLSCVLENLGNVPEMKRLAGTFPLAVRVSTTDRYGANGRTEEGLRCEFPSFVGTHLACDIHRCSTCINTMMKNHICQRDVSGLLNSALSLSELGSVKKLRDALISVLFDDLEIIPGQAPVEANGYRKRVFDTFLPIEGVLRPVEKVNRKRRHILASVLNGFINRPEIRHFCEMGCCSDKEETLTHASLFLTWALVPFACPVLCRKSWIGQLGNLNWIGVLEAHHGLFVRLMNKFFSKPQAAPAAHPVSGPSDEWAAALEDELQSQAPQADPSSGRAQEASADAAPQEDEGHCCPLVSGLRPKPLALDS